VLLPEILPLLLTLLQVVYFPTFHHHKMFDKFLQNTANRGPKDFLVFKKLLVDILYHIVVHWHCFLIGINLEGSQT